MNFLLGLSPLLLATLSACQSPTSSDIAKQFEASGGNSIDLATAVPGNWDRVCILGPYSRNAAAAKTLGFEWPAESHSRIAGNDGISLLVFVRGNAVENHVEHPRRAGDFSNLSGRCFSQSDAKFFQVDKPGKGWSGLFPAKEA
jgi:hypothetical protein